MEGGKKGRRDVKNKERKKAGKTASQLASQPEEKAGQVTKLNWGNSDGVTGSH